MGERRHIPRWQIRKSAKVKVGPDGDFIDCIIEDVNLKGLQLSVDKQLPTDSRLEMVVALAENFGLDMKVNVPWSRQIGGRYVYGMAFSIIADEDKEKIYQYVSHHFPEQFQKQWWSGRDGEISGT